MSLRRRISLLVIISLVLGLAMLGTGAGAFESAQLDRPIDSDLPVIYGTEGMIPDSVIVKFDSFTEARVVQTYNTLPGVAWERTMSTRPLARFRITDGSTPFEMITRLRSLPNIVDVYPNFRRSAALTPNDPYFTLQKEEIQVAQIPRAWDIETGSSDVLVAVIDTGVDDAHPDLLPNLVLPGVNVRGDAEVDVVLDDSGHGTAVMGIIGAVGNNGIGVAGTAWNVRMLPIRACGGSDLGCDIFAEIAAIDVARERGANIINLSIGGVGTISDEELAVTAAYEAGIVIVAAAGNANPGWYYEATGDPAKDRVSLYYPAALPEVIGVGAVSNDAQAAEFSNYGEDILSVMAPGVDIVTTVPDYKCYLYEGGDAPPYGLAKGTSFATPMVSGVAALILSHFPGLSPDDVRARIEGTAIPMAGPDDDQNGINDYYGHGILNAVDALSQGVAPENPYFRLGVSSSPIFAGEVIVLVQALVPLDSDPTANWSLPSGASGSVTLEAVGTRPGFYIGRFNPGSAGNVSVSVTGMSGGAPLPVVKVMYILGDG